MHQLKPLEINQYINIILIILIRYQLFSSKDLQEIFFAFNLVGIINIKTKSILNKLKIITKFSFSKYVIGKYSIKL